MLAVLAIAVALPAQAPAEAGDPASDPTAAQYAPPSPLGISEQSNPEESNPGDVTEFAAASVGGESAAESPGGTLPLTGFDAVALLAVAVALLATGLTLRRLTGTRG